MHAWLQGNIGQQPYLQLLNFLVSVLQLYSGKVSVEPVHLDRIQHWMDSECSTESWITLSLRVCVLPKLKVLVS